MNKLHISAVAIFYIRNATRELGLLFAACYGDSVAKAAGAGAFCDAETVRKSALRRFSSLPYVRSSLRILLHCFLESKFCNLLLLLPGTDPSCAYWSGEVRSFVKMAIRRSNKVAIGLGFVGCWFTLRAYEQTIMTTTHSIVLGFFILLIALFIKEFDLMSEGDTMSKPTESSATAPSHQKAA